MSSKDTPHQSTPSSQQSSQRSQPSTDAAAVDPLPAPHTPRASGPLNPGDLRLLQRTLGNRAVGRLISRSTIQRVKGLIPQTYVEVNDEDTQWYGQIVKSSADSYDIRVGGTDSIVTVPQEQVSLHPTAKELIDRQNKEWRANPATLDSILNQGSVEANVSMDEMEMRMQSPGGLFGTVVSPDNLSNVANKLKDQAKQDEQVRIMLVQLIIEQKPQLANNQQAVTQNLSIFLTTDVIKQMLPPQYAEVLLRQKDISGSCGATAEMLMGLVSKNGQAAPMTKGEESGIDGVIDTLLAQKVLHWYCRISRRPHAFVIECMGGWGKIYQSYFGLYPLADDMRKGSVFPIRILLEQLRRCLKNQEASLEEKKALFHTAPAFSGPIEFQLNTDPAQPKQIVQHVGAQLKLNQAEWQDYMTGSKSKTPLGELFAQEQVDVELPAAQVSGVQFLDAERMDMECYEDSAGEVGWDAEKENHIGTIVYWENALLRRKQKMKITEFKNNEYKLEPLD